MFYALSGFFVLALLALWSLAVWAVHAMVVWTISRAGALAGSAASAGTLPVPDWLAPWVPPELVRWASEAMGGLVPLIDGLLQSAPAWAGGVTAAAWVIWGIGGVALVLLAAGLHLLIAHLRRHGRDGSGSSVRPSLTGARERTPTPLP